jgi:hypothetical protein
VAGQLNIGGDAEPPRRDLARSQVRDTALADPATKFPKTTSSSGTAMSDDTRTGAPSADTNAALASRISAVCANVRPTKVAPYHSTR